MSLDILRAIQLRDGVYVVVCLLFGAFFQAAETGLLTMAHARIQEVVKEAEGRGQRLTSLLRLWIQRPDHVLTAIVVGKHAAHMAIVLGVIVTLENADQSAGLSLWLALTVGALLLAVIVAVELVARAVAKEKAPLAVSVTFPVVVMAYVGTWPVVMVLTRLSRLAARLAGGNASRSGPFVTEQDIVEMIALGRKTGAIDKVEGRMLTSIIELGDTLVREVMVPRTEISSLPVEATWLEVMAEVKEEGHSRLPVYDGTLDDIRGFFHTKDLLTGDIDPKRFRLQDHLRPVEFVPELGRVSDLLRTFQRKKTHLAVVVDEFGGTSGIVALEDVLEEIVGPIQDEHDDEEAQIKRLSDTRFTAEGRASLYDLAEVLGITFPEGGYETVGGFLIARAGRMPRVGDNVGYEGHIFVVVEADERKVSRVDIERTAPLQATEASGPNEPAPGDLPADDSERELTTTPAEHP
jgi:CBS domain containing-hemolysin-like protein